MDQHRQETLLRMHEFYADEARHQRQMMWDTAKWFTPVLIGLAWLWIIYYTDKFHGHDDPYKALLLLLISTLGFLLSSASIMLLRSFYRANMKYITMYAKVEDELQVEPRRRSDKEFFLGDEHLNWYQYVSDRKNEDISPGDGHTSEKFVEKKTRDTLPTWLEEFCKGKKNPFTIYDLTRFVFYLFAVCFLSGVILIIVEVIEMPITRPHIGIIVTLIGTVLLAFSVRVKRQHDKELRKVADEAKQRHPGLTVPTETYIVRSFFWLGLLLVAVGAGLQW